MLPTVTYIAGIAIPGYGLMVLLGVAAGVGLLLALARKFKRIALQDALFAVLFALCGGIVGSVAIRPGHIVFFGGMLGGAAGMLAYCRIYKISAAHMLDIAAPALAIGHAIGRIGCLLGGCCYGIPVWEGHPLAIIYPQASLAAPAGVPLLAVPVIEAAFLAALAAVCLTALARTKKDGISAVMYLLLYPVIRFTIEFFRGDAARGAVGLLSTSQIISLGVFAAGVILLVRIVKAASAARIHSQP